MAPANSGIGAAERVCMNPGGNAAKTSRAQAIAAQILKGAGVQVEFKYDLPACTGLRSAIVITVSEQTSATEHPGSLSLMQCLMSRRTLLSSMTA
jgi:hypothetical protein